MTAPPPSLTEVISDGRWLAHRYDAEADAIQFRWVPRDAQRAMTFLTDAEFGDAPMLVLPRTESVDVARRMNLPVPRLIFHSAYCCSTLLARSFDLPGVSFGFKEPQILNDVIGLQLRGGDPRQVAAALDAALTLLSRTPEPGEVSVVKPSNLVNPLLPLFMALRPGLRGVLLFAPLEAFLTSIARKEVEGRAWVRELMWKYLRLGQVKRFGFSEEELYRQTDLQVGALGWLAQCGLFVDAVGANAGFRTLDSEVLMARPRDCLLELGKLLDLQFEPDDVLTGPAFNTHSKSRDRFSPQERNVERERGRQIHEREIEMVIQWSKEVARHADLPADLPSPLISES